MSPGSFADVDAGVRRVVAEYTHALDDGRVDDVVATFCPDGAIDMPGIGRHAGHQPLRAAYDAVRPRAPQRHLVLNTHVVRCDDHEAEAVSDVVVLVRRDDAWVVALVGRYTDVLHRDGEHWRFHHRQLRITDAS